MNTYNKYNMLAYLFLAVIIIILIIPACTATSIQKFSIDSKTYSMGDTISVSGEILDGNASGQVEIIISNDSAWENTTTVNASNSIFSATVTAPAESGNYMIKAQDVISGTISPYLNFTVLGINDPKKIKILFTQGQVLTVSLSTNHNIQGPLNVSKTGGNIEFDGTDYYFLVSDDDTVYMDDDDDMNLSSDDSGVSTIGNLVEGSKVKLNTTIYTFIHIHNESGIVLARCVAPSFTGGESVNATLVAVNASDYSVNASITLYHLSDDGTLISNTGLSTGDNGVVNTIINISTNSGVYHLIAGDVGHISFAVNTVDMFGDILSDEYKPRHTFSRGDTLIPVVYVKNISSGAPMADAGVTAKIICAGNVSKTQILTLTYDSNISGYTYLYTVPSNADIDSYNVEYNVSIGSQSQKAYTCYDVKAYDLFLKPIAEKMEDCDGFAPGEKGYLIMGGTDLSNGEPLNIIDLTDLNIIKFKLNITDSSGIDVTESWSVMNLTTFEINTGAPDGVTNEIKQKFGENATIFNFTIPQATGIYKVVVQVNISEWARAGTSISVQDMFVHGEPVNKNGWFSPKVSPGGTVRLMIIAFNPQTGEMLSANDIHEAGLVEVRSAGTGDIVTEHMLNTSLDTIDMPFMDEIKILTFEANDSQLGFHHVIFWVNATVGGTPKTVIGDGWFDEKLYNIRAKPTKDDTTGMYRIFGSNNDTISLDVTVKDVGGKNKSDATIKIDSVHYGMTGEMVLLEDSMTSFTTDGNGKATVTFDAESSLKSGFYHVRIKMTTQEGTTDYGNGWFEVSNFIFYTYPTSWNIGLDQPINFSMNAFDSSFNASNVSVNLTKIISMGDWDMMAPPTVYNDTIVNCGYINGTGYYNYTQGLEKGGNFEFVFEAFDGNSTEVGRAWIYLTAFSARTETDNWQHDYAVDDFVNFTVVASTNITNVTVEKVMQEGMWMSTYRSKSDMEGNYTTEDYTGDEKKINVSVNTTGWSQSFYSMMLKATDDKGNEVNIHFWFRLQLASVTVPKIMWLDVSGSSYHTNGTSFNVTTDVTTKKDKFANSNLSNVTQGKVGGIILNGDHNDAITMIIGSDMDQIVDWNHSHVPYFAMVVVDTVQKTVYIEYENQSNPNTQYYNLSNPATTQVFNASQGDNFTDYTGRNWNITEITSDGTVKLEGINCLKNGLFMDQTVMSKSKSGKFLMDSLHDCKQSGLDLDGDGNTDWNEKYHILMVDTTTAGKYDTVLISNLSNFSDGTYINASADVVGFGGKPTYLISNRYKSGVYELRFTTYKKGWPGMHLGTYANESVVKMPFLVLQPSGTAINNSKVTIDFLMDESRDKQTLTGINGTTDAYGLTIISLDTSQTPIQTGEWMIHYNASIGSEYAVADEEMFWEMTRFELRNFEVSGALGIPGSIDFIQLSDSNTNDGLPGNNMLLNFGDEVEFMRGIGVWSSQGSKYRLEYPFNNWYYNSSTGYFNFSTDGGSTLNPGNLTNINSSNARTVMDYNVTLKNNTGDTITLNSGINTFYEDMWIFNVTQINGTTDVTILMSYAGWPWTMPGDEWSHPDEHTIQNQSTWWMGGLSFTVSTINETNDTVILTLKSPILIAEIDAVSNLLDNNPDNGELDKMRGSVNTVTFNSHLYHIYGYEDKATTSGDIAENAWINTMDRVLVENISSGDTNIYCLGENIIELDNYYAASVSEWGGKIVLLNGSVTQVFPIPQWSSDAPIYYAGKFSETDVGGVDIPLLGIGFEPCIDFSNISSDKRYSILLYDCLANGENYPSEGMFDDDGDLTNIGGWDEQIAYDMYGNESGYGDSLSRNANIDCDSGYEIPWINMSEYWVQEVGTGKIDREDSISIPSLTINNTAKTATAKTFAAYDDFDRSDNITILVTAKEFTGSHISGNATLSQLKMMMGGSYSEDEGLYFIEDLPKTWSIDGVNATLVDGEGILKLTPDQMPEDLEPGQSHDFIFGQFTAIAQITDSLGGSESLKMNFFMVNRTLKSQLMGKEGEGDRFK